MAGGVTEKAGFLKAFRVGHKKRGKWHAAARAAGPFARNIPQRFGEPQLSKVHSESPVPSPNL